MLPVGQTRQSSKRQRGSIETLPSGSLRVKVYAGYDPVSGRRHYLDEEVSAGPRAATEADGFGPDSCRRSTSSGIPRPAPWSTNSLVACASVMPR